MQSSIFSAGLVLAWLVTPESMNLVSRYAGLSGAWYFLSLTMGAVLAMLCTSQMYSAQMFEKGLISDVKVLKKAYGETISTAIMLCGRIPFLLFASTGLLVTASFAFNEIFVYWFPNFLFASILLIAVALLNIYAEPVVIRFQFVFTAIAVIGLVILIVMGLSGGEVTQSDLPLTGRELTPSLLKIGFVTFLEFDFHKCGQNNSIVYISLSMGLLIISAWAYIAFKLIGAEHMVQSSITHMLVAKAVGGELGRYIMGAVVIAAVSSCVNAMFIVTRRIFGEMVEARIFPNFAQKGWFISLFITIVIGLMMFNGLAGEDILDTQIYASIMLWLLYVGLRTGAAVYVLQK